MRRASVLACIVIFVLAVDIGFVSIASAVKPDRYNVIFEKAARKAVKDAIKANFGDVIKKELKLVDVVVVTLPSEDAEGLSRIPGVLKVVPADYATIRFHKPPPGKGKPEKGEELPWGVDRIDSDIVWDPDGNLIIDTPGAITGSGIKVAIVDTGIDISHSDLNVAGGINAVEPGQPPNDERGHGTMCAGVVAALDNEKDVIGVAPGVELYAVKLAGQAGDPWYIDYLYTGMEWCINGPDGLPPDDPNDNGDMMQAINMSFGVEDALGNPVDDSVLHSYLTVAHGFGMVLVASAGNDGRDLDVIPQYPVSYVEVSAVSATGMKTTGKPSERGDYFASWSNYGDGTIDVAAPGVSVKTTAMGGGTSSFSGTSASCPHVVGVAALVLERFGPQSPGNLYVKDWLKSTAEWLDALTVDQQGAGLVDAEDAVPLPSSAPPRTHIVSPVGKIAATWAGLRRK